MRSSRFTFHVSHWLCCALVFSCAMLSGAEKPRDAAAPQLSESEVKAVGALLERLASAFESGDAAACLRLFATDAPERARIEQHLRNEFEQAFYMRFEILNVLPDDRLQPNLHSVDAHFRFIAVDRGWEQPMRQTFREFVRSLEAGRSVRTSGDELLRAFIQSNPQLPGARLSPPVVDATNQTFVVTKLDDGSFALWQSPFFENLGMQQGMGLVAKGLLAVMALCAMAAFWVWMGLEAFRARPRYPLWRVVVALVPVLGACAFFVAAYLPTRFKERRA